MSQAANLQFDESSSVLLVIEAFIVFKRGNLLIVKTVWRFTPRHNCVSLQSVTEQHSAKTKLVLVSGDT